MNKLYKISDVAKFLGVNRNYVYALIRHGHLEALKLGSLKVTSFELEGFLKRNSGKDFTDLNNVVELKFGDDTNAKKAQ